MEKIKCITFDTKAQNEIPQHIKDRMKKDRLQAECEHHPFDRDIDINENQYCTNCGKITKTAEELYPDDEII